MTDPFTLPVPAPKNVEEFRALYRAKYGLALSWDEACKALTSLMQLLHAVDQARSMSTSPAPSESQKGRQ